jgi:hypothetical protein
VTAETRQLPQRYGVVTYQFEWVGFAETDGDRLVVGDALGGLFLDEESRLVLAWPDGYEPATVSPDGYEERDDAVTWTGPVDFGPDEPRVVVRQPGPGLASVVAVGAVLAVGLGAVGWVYRRRRESEAGAGVKAGGGTGRGADEAADDSLRETAHPDDETDGDTPDVPPKELLSPEERLLTFVRDRGGRVKQQQVVSEFEWTAARTSQVVGSLRDEGAIETFRLGRENVITLPDEDVVGQRETGDGEGGDGDKADEGKSNEERGVDWRPD